MAAKKIRDVAVKVGEYQDRQTGDTKGRYQNIGALMKNDDGSVFILLARWFNPAGVTSDRETVLLSCFELRDQNGDGGQQSQRQARPAAQRQQPDEDIPF